MNADRIGNLRELETRIRSTLGAWNHYRLRVWQACRSFEAASVDARIETAEGVLADIHRGDVIWAWGGFVLLTKEIQDKLDDPDALIRQEAAIALADLGTLAGSTIPQFLERLGSHDGTFHDRACAAWALPRIGVAGHQVVPVLLQVLQETADQPEADELRFRAAEAIESLTDSLTVLVPLARRCLRDQYRRCRMHGLLLAERLGTRHRRLLDMLMPNVEPLLDDEVEEVREIAQRIVEGFAKGVSQSS